MKITKLEAKPFVNQFAVTNAYTYCNVARSASAYLIH